MVSYVYVMAIARLPDGPPEQKETFGRIGRPLKSNRVLIPPQIRLRKHRITWQRPGETKWHMPTDKTLADFIKLADSPESQIEAFAESHGVFGAAQLREDAPVRDNEITSHGKRWAISGEWNFPTWEPVELWRDIARTARSMVRLAHAFKRVPPRLGEPEDWKEIQPDFDPRAEAIEDAQYCFWSELNAWLKVGRVALRLHPLAWSKTRLEWQTEIDYGGYYNLFGALAVQLMLDTAGVSSLEVCDSCKQLYFRKSKRPNPGHRNYCEDCADQPLKVADAKRKDKMKRARALYSDGWTAEKIAAEVDAAHESVSRWISKTKQKGNRDVKKTRQQ